MGALPRLLLGIVAMMRETRHYDALVIPGMGVLEGSLGEAAGPTGMPLQLFILSICSRIWRVPLVYLNVGVSPVPNRASRWLMSRAASWATYRSFRDEYSRTAAEEMGINTDGANVAPDVAFLLRTCEDAKRAYLGASFIAIGVMTYTHDDKNFAEEVQGRYVEAMTSALLTLLSRDQRVLLFTGDDSDVVTAEEIVRRVESHSRTLRGGESGEVGLLVTPSLSDLVSVLRHSQVLIASRHHNVIAGLLARRPVGAITYARKTDCLLRDVTDGRYTADFTSVTGEQIVQILSRLDENAVPVVLATTAAVERYRRELATQFGELWEALIGPELGHSA
jgi:polysaccharide pyruvyl transferase WcaK-like protein